jgi:hypothetical protein
MMVANRRPIERGQMPPPAEPRHQLGGVLLSASDCFGLLLVVALISAC